MQGIYKIENVNNGMKYIGSSTDIESRWNQHVKMLNNNCHHSIKLQNAYNITKDISMFNFAVIEEVKFESQLIYREQYWMDYYNTYQNGYNGTKRADCLDKRTKDAIDQLSDLYRVKFQYLLDKFNGSFILDNICIKMFLNEKNNISNIDTINHLALWCINDYGTEDIGVKIEFRKNPFKNKKDDFVVHVYDESVKKQIFRAYASDILTQQND